MAEFRPVLVPMIETRRGVAAAEALAGLPVVDALFFGPYDLSADLGRPGDFADKEFRLALDAVKSACAHHGKAAGGHQVAPDRSELHRRVAEGFRFLAYGTDILAMRHALADFRAALVE
jgi:2-keto-3-deoxy-L-rhamnonate aldolase RhmA